MAAVCVKGHSALALPVAGKQRRISGLFSSSFYPRYVITAKTGPKLETKGGKQTPKTHTVFQDFNGRKVKITLLPETADKQRKASDRSGKEKRQNMEINDEPQAKTIVEEDEEGDSLVEVGEAANNVEEFEEEGEEWDDDDEEESDVEPELEEVLEMFVPPGAVLSSDKPLSKLPGSNIYLGPHAKSAKVKEAAFVKSSTSFAECPPPKLPEFAVVGRSNVGKSSLVNSLVKRKDLAQTSKKPGKTRLINHFIINQSWYLVDLPGFGYAKVPANVRASWDHFTKDFFLQSKCLVCVMLLVDASIPPQQIDLEYADWLYQRKIAMTVVFTKCDRKKKKKNGGRKPVENVKDFLKMLKGKFDESPPWIMTSCVTNQGKEGLLMHIAQLRNYWST